MQFFLGVISSLIASAIVIVCSALFSRKFRRVLTAVLSRLLDIDIECVFRNPAAAASDIRAELALAEYVDLFTGRGSELQRGTFASLLGERTGSVERKFRVILPNPKPKRSERDWISEREGEISAIDSGFGKGVLREQVQMTITFLEPHIQNGFVSLRLINFPHIGRILLTDRVAYLTPYRKSAHARDCRVIKYRRGGEMYDALARLVNQLWEDASEVTLS